MPAFLASRRTGSPVEFLSDFLRFDNVGTYGMSCSNPRLGRVAKKVDRKEAPLIPYPF